MPRPGQPLTGGGPAELAAAWDALQADADFLSLGLTADEPTPSGPMPRAGRQLLRASRTPTRSPRSASSSPSRPGSATSGSAASSTGSTAPPTASWWSSTTRPAGPRGPAFEQAEAGRASTLRPAVPGGPRPPPGPGQAAPPEGATVITAEPSEQAATGPAQKTAGRLVGHRAGLRGRGLPAPDLPLCRFCRFQRLLPGLRRRPGARPPPPSAAHRPGCRHDRRPTAPVPTAAWPVRPPAPVGPASVEPAPTWSPSSTTRVDAWFEPLRGNAGGRRARPRWSPASATTGCCGRRRPSGGPAGRARRGAGPSGPWRSPGSSPALVNAGLKGVVGRDAARPRPTSACRQRGPGPRADDQQLPERPHPGRLLRRHRHEPGGATGPATPSFHRRRAGRGQPDPPAGPPRLRRARRRGHRHRPRTGRPAGSADPGDRRSATRTG